MREIMSKTVDRTSDPERQKSLEALRKSLREKRATGYRVGRITEDDKYGDDSA